MGKLEGKTALKGKLDIVFANAGTADFASLGKITEEHFDSIFNIKRIAAFASTH